MSNDFNLSDYYTGTSFDETSPSKTPEYDFTDFDEGAAISVPKQADIEPEKPKIDETRRALPCKVDDLDLQQPPGFVGAVADWIDGQCRYPRRKLAVASAIVAIGNIGGMRHEDERDGVTANMMAFCVAASSTGKEAVTQAFTELHVKAGIQSALHGSMKSEQEVTRNAVEHQGIFFNIDEIGIFLTKVRRAQKGNGNAAYLEGIFGVLMSMYSKANSVFPLSGDMTRELRKIYAGQLASAQDRGEEGQEAAALRKLEMLDAGLDRPFMSLIGYTTPSTFDGVMDAETATQGLVGRAIIVNEPDINPHPRLGFKRLEMPLTMQMKVFSMTGREVGDKGIVEYRGERLKVTTDDDAGALLDAILLWLIEYASEADEATGEASVAMVRRAFEMVAKVSFILAIPERRRTLEHVRWAFAYIKAELDDKVALVFANDNAKERPDEALAARILARLDPDKPVSARVLSNRMKQPEDVLVPILEKLKASGDIFSEKGKRKSKGQFPTVWRRSGDI